MYDKCKNEKSEKIENDFKIRYLNYIMYNLLFL